jgi:RNA 3'-terminal phosphate cyclase (ATP)
MGAELTLSLEKPGFYPVGGGRIQARAGNATWRRLELLERGAIRSVWARALVSRLPISIAHRELAVVEKGLDWPEESLTAAAIDADGPGNALILVVESGQVTEVFTGFGRRGLPAEEVASQTVAKTRRYLDSGVAVGMHLADQLLVPLTQSKGGSFLTSEPSTHFETNAGVIDRFFDLKITTRPMGENLVVDCRVE